MLLSRILCVFASAVMVFAPAAPAGGLTRQADTLESGPGTFTCGSGGLKNLQSLSYYYEYLENQKRSVSSLSRIQVTADYVFDDVWVVENDGTLTLSGNHPFDTILWRFIYTPNLSDGYDAMFANPFFDPVPGVDLGLGDDDAVVVDLQFSFEFFGTAWTQMYVSANGVVSFGGD